MNHIKKVLSDALNEYNLDNNIEEPTYRYYLPGIVKTGDAQNQVLQLDSMDPDYDDPYNELILHMPLEQEGQSLQIEKLILNNGDEVETFIYKMIHIPFESGVILLMTQLHGDHYGRFVNTQFYCVISTKKGYEGTHLFLANKYLRQQYEAKNTSDILKMGIKSSGYDN